MYYFYDFNFAQTPDDDISNSVKSNGTDLSVDLNSCNIDTVNNLDSNSSKKKIRSKEASKDVSDSIKTRDVNTQIYRQSTFNHGIVNNNLNVDTIVD